MKLKYAKLNCRSAFTLIEVAMTSAILGVVFAAFYSGIAAGFSLVGLTRENLRADQLLLERMETIRLYSWDQISSNGFIPPSFTAPFYPPIAGQTNTGVTYYGTLAIANVPLSVGYTNNMKMVTASLTWTNGGHQRVRTMSTFVSQFGLQSYVY